MCEDRTTSKERYRNRVRDILEAIHFSIEGGGHIHRIMAALEFRQFVSEKQLIGVLSGHA